MSIAKQRQAGVEIEITPEMIEAGLGAIAEFDSDELSTESETIVRSIFRAMMAVAPGFGSQALRDNPRVVRRCS